VFARVLPNMLESLPRISARSIILATLGPSSTLDLALARSRIRAAGIMMAARLPSRYRERNPRASAAGPGRGEVLSSSLPHAAKRSGEGSTTRTPPVGTVKTLNTQIYSDVPKAIRQFALRGTPPFEGTGSFPTRAHRLWEIMLPVGCGAAQPSAH